MGKRTWVMHFTDEMELECSDRAQVFSSRLKRVSMNKQVWRKDVGCAVDASGACFWDAAHRIDQVIYRRLAEILDGLF